MIYLGISLGMLFVIFVLNPGVVSVIEKIKYGEGLLLDDYWFTVGTVIIIEVIAFLVLAGFAMIVVLMKLIITGDL